MGGRTNLDLFYFAFSTYDLDHNGQISEGELFSALKDIEAKINGDSADYTKVSKIIKAVFANKERDTTIGFSEFLSLGQDGTLDEAAKPTIAAQTESEHWFED